MHPFLTGRLARWRVVERWLERIVAERKVWFASLEDIAAHLDGLVKAGTYQVRVETLPYFTQPVS